MKRLCVDLLAVASLLLLAGTATAGTVTTGPADGPAPEVPPVVHWRLVGPDLEVVAGEGPLTVSRKTWRRITHGWVWTRAVAPVRLPVDELQWGEPPPVEKPVAGAARRTSPLSLSVRLQGLPPRRSNEPEGAEPPDELGFELIAAPLAMWYEVPEALLPAHPVPASGRLEIPHSAAEAWRLRAWARDAGPQALGSWWFDVPPRASTEVGLLLQPASDVEMALVDEQGEAVEGAWLRTFPSADSRSFCLYRAVDGEVKIPLLPDLRALSVAAVAPGYLSTFSRAYPSLLPRRLTLDPGVRLRGRFVDEDNLPVEGVEVVAEGWLEGTPPIPYRSRAETDEEGSFLVAPVPLGRAVVRATHRDFATFHRTLVLDPVENDALERRWPADGEIERWTLDLGRLPLHPGLRLEVRVEDELGDPVVGATVTTRPPRQRAALTDREGRASLSAVDPEAVLEVEADAAGFLSASTRSLPPHPSLLKLRLDAAFTLTGRFLDSSGKPVSDGSVLVRSERQLQTALLEPDGSFELKLTPETAYRLTLRGPSTGEYALSVRPGQPGERRDLGDLKARESRSVTGRLVDGRDGQPVAGARIWTPRPDGNPPLRAWFFGDWLETRSDARGRFRLAGLGELPARLRIEAGGFARTEVGVDPDPERLETELGDIELLPGTTLRVHVEGIQPADRRRFVVRLDPERAWRESDMLSAPVHDGLAVLPDVPAGEAILTVLRADVLACEREVVIPPGVEEKDVTCSVQPVQLRGQVLLGGRPAPGGHLHWSPPSVEGPALILRRRSQMGAESTTVYGAGRPDLEVPVGESGGFATDRVAPGRWQVVWYGEGGSGTTPETVEVPADVAQWDVILEYPDYGLEGRVVDRDGDPVPGARIHERVTLTTTPVSADGRFQLLGLGPGRYVLQAVHEDRRSGWREVEVPKSGDPDPVELVLGDEKGGESFEVQVLTPDGEPAPGAFVFVETDRHAQRLLTADVHGRLAVDSGNAAPTVVRFAVFHGGHWLLGSLRPWQEAAEEGVRLQLQPGGGLRLLHGGAGEEDIALESANRWDVTWLLRRLGKRARLRPGEPWEIQGLPPGAYRLEVAGVPRAITIQRERTEEIELR